MSKLYLFSSVTTCPPCRFLKQALDGEFPGWLDKVEYIDPTDKVSKEIEGLLSKHKIYKIPTMFTEDKIIGSGFGPIYNHIKSLY